MKIYYTKMQEPTGIGLSAAVYNPKDAKYRRIYVAQKASRQCADFTAQHLLDKRIR